MIGSALLINGVPIECIQQASRQYYVPVTMIISVIKAEAGQVGMAKLNNNGTIDYGPMQINSIWLSKIAPYGYTAHDLQYDPCSNVMVGTWILAQEIADGKNLWQGVGDYHSHTYYENAKYGNRVNAYYNWLQHALRQD